MSGFQKGFISQLLLVLLLAAGIAAGTILVQNGVNFLPKAQQSTSECTSGEVENCTLEGANGCKISGGFHYCYDLDGQACIGNKLYAANTQAPTICTGDTRNCGLVGFTNSPKPAKYACINDANYNLWKSFVANRFSEAGKAVPGGCKPEDYNSKCGGKGGCYQNSSGNPVCLLEGTTCTSTQQQSCKDTYGLENCKIVGGEVRCIYPPNQPCNKNETCPSGSTCQVVERTYKGSKYRYSECTAKCNDGWWNYCAIVYEKGCNTDSQGVPICEGTMAPRSVAQKAASAPAPGTGAPAAPAGGAGAPAVNKVGTPATTTGGAATSADCGYEYNGTKIPCYRIGVFDDKTRQQIEQNVKIASQNYILYEKVLSEIGGLMDAAAKKKAGEALQNAKNAAACIK